MRTWSIAALAFVWLSSAAFAQTPNPVIEHYQAYRAAMQNADYATAETEATLALDASIARDGDGRRTAVLALNLALVRLHRGNYDGALQPAQRAFSLAEAGAQGVDPLYAAIALGRAELGAEQSARGERLSAALATPEITRIAADEIYSAAFELGSWALGQREYETARSAWSAAATHGEGSPYGEAYGRAYANTYEAAAIVLQEIGEDGDGRIDPAAGQQAYDLLAEAVRVLCELAQADSPTLDLTVAQRSYAEALAWLHALRAKLRSDRQRLPELQEAQGDADGFAELRGPAAPAQPRCRLRLNHNPAPRFPSAMMSRGQIGAVILRLRINDAGDIDEITTVARVGNEAFSDAVHRVASRWSVTVRDDSPANCRLASNVLAPVIFSMAQLH